MGLLTFILNVTLERLSRLADGRFEYRRVRAKKAGNGGEQEV